MSIASPEMVRGQVLARELNDTLRMELGWEEVAKGLTRVLCGYGVWVVGGVMGVVLALVPLLEMGTKFRPDKLTVAHMWYMYAGLGLVSVASLFANGLILAGQWKCVLNASERGWARWWMFLCLVTLAMGPALSIASTFGGLQKAPELARGMNGLQQVRYTTVGIILQLTSYGFGILYVVSFCLFLQASADCMRSWKHVRLVNLFLSFFVPLAVVTAYLAVRITVDPTQITKLGKPLMFVGLGWVVSFFSWLLLMALVRGCILQTMGLVRNPLEYSNLQGSRGR
jgi:hypothetical protein